MEKLILDTANVYENVGILVEKLNEVIDHLNSTDCKPYNREALLDCLISNKCDKLTARDLVAWGAEQRGKRLKGDSQDLSL